MATTTKRKRLSAPAPDDNDLSRDWTLGPNGRTIGFAQPLLADGLRSLLDNYGGIAEVARHFRQVPSAFFKFLSGHARFPEPCIATWVRVLGLKGQDAQALRDAFALATTPRRILVLIPAWKTKAKALSVRLGAIKPRAGKRAKG
jgi:hypothetical protein